MNDNRTRAKILETMYSLIAEKGYDKASIGQIADTIGIKKASVYYYFKSKEDILLQLMKELYRDNYSARDELFRAGISVESYRNELIAMGEDFINSYFENHDLRKVYAEIDIQATRIPALKEFVNLSDASINEFLIRCMEQGAALGAFAADCSIKLNAQILYTILIGIDQAILYDLNVDAKAVWKEMILKLF